MQNTTDRLFMCAFNVPRSHEAVWPKTCDRLAAVLRQCMPPPTDPCLECLARAAVRYKQRGQESWSEEDLHCNLARVEAAVRCEQRGQESGSDEDLHCNLARLRNITAADRKKLSPKARQCFLIVETATRIKCYKCVSLNIIESGVQCAKTNIDFSNMPVNEMIHIRHAEKYCTSLRIHKARQFLTCTSKNEHGSAEKKLHSSSSMKGCLNLRMEIRNLKQNPGHPVLCSFLNKCCQTLSCEMFTVSSQTQNIQHKCTILKTDSQRKKRSPRTTNRSESRANPTEEGSNKSRGKRQNNSGTASHGTNHVVTTYGADHVETTDGANHVVTTEGTNRVVTTQEVDHVTTPEVIHVTTPEDNHVTTPEVNHIVSTHAANHFVTTEGANHVVTSEEANHVVSTHAANHVVKTHGVNHILTTQRPVLLNETLFLLLKSLFPQIDSPENADHLYAHHYTVTDRQHTSTKHGNTPTVSSIYDFPWMNDNATSASPKYADLNIKSTVASINNDVLETEPTYSTETRTITSDRMFTIETSSKHINSDNTRADMTGSATTTTNTHATDKDGVTTDVTEQQSTSALSATDITSVFTPQINSHNAAVTEETTKSNMRQSTTNTISDETSITDVVTANNTIAFTTTNNVTAPRVVTVTDPSPTTVTAEATTNTDTTKLNIATHTYSTIETSNSVTNVCVTCDSTTDITTLNGAPTTASTTTDVKTLPKAISIENTVQTPSAGTSLVFTTLATNNNAIIVETTNAVTVVSGNDARTGGREISRASTFGTTLTVVQTTEALPTESVISKSVMEEVTPDSRPYGAIEETTAVHTLTTNVAGDFTTKQGTVSEASFINTLKPARKIDNPTNNKTIQTVTIDATTSSITVEDRITPIATAKSAATMSNNVSEPNITNPSLNMDVSSLQATSYQAIDSESAPSRTKPAPTIHVLGTGVFTRRDSNKDTTTATFPTSNATSSTLESVVSDVVSTMMGSKFQCSRSSGVACFLEAVDKSLHGAKSNITKGHVMDACELLLDNIEWEAYTQPKSISTTIITSYFQILDTFLSVSMNSTPLCQTKRLDDTLTKVTSFVDNVMQSMKLHIRQDIQRTYTYLDLLVFQLKPEQLKGKQLNMRSVTINVDDIDMSNPGNASVVVAALVLTVPNAEVTLVNSKIAVMSSLVLSLSAAIGGSKVSLIHTFMMPIARPTDKTIEPVCGFQSQNENETIWETQGCQLISYTDEVSTTEPNSELYLNLTDDSESKRNVVCSCNHTTNFAILMRIVDFEIGEKDELALSIISYLGCSMTLITQVMAITVFTCIRSLNSERVCVHRNLCISIMAAQITFISGIKAVQNKVVCAVVAVLLHYFYTCSFMWMLVEGLHLYNMIINVFGTERSRIVYYTCIGYGLPLLLVAISAVVDWEGYGTKYSCWLSIHRSTIWAFVGPAMAIIIVNFVILAVVIKIVVSSARVDKNTNYDHIRAGIKATVLLLPLLGLTWIFGLAAVSQKLIVFQYLFAILNTLQGFFIFMLHCVFNTEVRQTLNRLREKRSQQKIEFSTPAATHNRSSSSDSRSSASTYVTIRETMSSAFNRRTIQVSPADFSFTQDAEKRSDTERTTMRQTEKQLIRVDN